MGKKMNYSMQVDVPHHVFGANTYFAAPEISSWLYVNKLTYRYCGMSSSGCGLGENGLSNYKSHYIVEHIHETDATAFQLKFPECKVSIFETKE